MNVDDDEPLDELVSKAALDWHKRWRRTAERDEAHRARRKAIMEAEHKRQYRLRHPQAIKQQQRARHARRRAAELMGRLEQLKEDLK